MSRHYCAKCVPDWERYELFASSPLVPCQKCGSRENVKHFPGEAMITEPMFYVSSDGTPDEFKEYTTKLWIALNNYKREE